MIKIIKNSLMLGLCLLVVACGASNPPAMSEGHLGNDLAPPDIIPEAVVDAPILPEPEQRPDLETYTVIVNQVPVRELLFSMARDAKLNIDVENEIKGKVTMNAIDQTLPQILERLSRQVAINYTLEDETLYVRADKPYLQLYDVDYLNMSRLSEGSVEVATEISSTGSGEAKGGGSGGNNSSAVVKNKSSNEFWKTLIVNIANVLGEEVKVTDKIQETSVNILVNRETGIAGVRATYKQHKQVQELLDRVLGSAQRQVMIEATIAEVTLSDHYQAGIDWSMMKVGSTGDTASISQNLLGGNLGTTPFFQLTGSNTDSSGDNLTGTLKALETFGDVKVLSSPKVMALNNQTAMLKVVDNEVYFSIEVEKGQVIDNVLYQGSITTTINTVPIGFVMSVMPYIDRNDVVTLHVRPTISRIIGRAVDPNPDLVNVTNEVPIIQVREIESVLKVNNGDTAVIGGLMQDQIIEQQSGVPILSSIPFIGALFSYQDDEYVKSELVIFIRPVVVHDASLDGDLKEYRKYLMEDFDATPVKSE